MSSLLLLMYLLYMDIGNPIFDYGSAHTYAMKSGAMLGFCNRVTGTPETSSAEIAEIKNFFENVPYRWFVDSKNNELIEKLEHSGLHFKVAYPVMNIALNSISAQEYGNDIAIKEIDPCLLKTWISIVVKSYDLPSEGELTKFIDYLIARSHPHNIHFYLGYYGDIPTAASMV